MTIGFFHNLRVVRVANESANAFGAHRAICVRARVRIAPLHGQWRRAMHAETELRVT